MQKACPEYERPEYERAEYERAEKALKDVKDAA
jgi:hypothetical protein